MGLTAVWGQGRTTRGPSAPGAGFWQSSTARRGPVKLGQRKSLYYSGEAQPATPGKGRVAGVSRKTPPAAPGKPPVWGPAYPRPLSQSIGSPFSRGSSLQPGAPPPSSAAAPPGLVPPAGRASCCRRRESRSCQGAARPLTEPPSSEVSRDTRTQAPFSFPALRVLPFASSFSKRRRERKAQGLGATHGSANSTRPAPTTPPNELQARGGLLPHRLQVSHGLLQQHLKGKGSPPESQNRWGFPEPEALGRHSRSCCCFFESQPGAGGFGNLPNYHQQCSSIGPSCPTHTVTDLCHPLGPQHPHG